MRCSAGVFFTWLTFLGCRQTPVAPKATGVVVLSDAGNPLESSGDSLAGVKTTSGRIAVSNLDGQIEEFTRLLDKSARRADMLQSLATLLPVRAQFLGRVEDYDLALADAEAVIALRPKDPKAYLTRAHARSSLHQFKDASSDLDEAARLGGNRLADEIDASRASILQATGHTTEAQEILQRRAKNDPEILTMGALGLTLADQGKITEADGVLAKAPLSYFGGLPFPVAWIEFQRGFLWERQGQPTKAIGYYRAAIERLPEYAVARAHLAGLIAAEGDREKGIAILREVTKTATDPEFVGQLAGLLAEVGQRDEAARTKEQATAGFEKLIAKHPAAFADHAARFYLGPGANPKRALELAKLNLEGRQTPDAFDLGLTAALEGGDSATACKLAGEAATAMPAIPTPHLTFLVGKGREACGAPTPARMQ